VTYGRKIGQVNERGTAEPGQQENTLPASAGRSKNERTSTSVRKGEFHYGGELIWYLKLEYNRGNEMKRKRRKKIDR